MIAQVPPNASSRSPVRHQHGQGLSWDILCRVVDNYGDAAVCWRLARALANEQAGQVRLWIDQPQALQALQALPSAWTDGWCFQGVSLHRLDAEGASLRGVTPAQVVVDAFGAGLPKAFEQAMAQRNPASLVIVLDYLSAESWVAQHHQMPSPHPQLPLQRYFFFPGFSADTGGLLKEADYDARHAAFVASDEARQRFWRGVGFDLPPSGARVMSLFGYENPALPGLLQALQATPSTVLAVPEGRCWPALADWFGVSQLRAGQALQRGGLQVRCLPFLDQDGYDELLWCCDWNLVRGEDSLVRAQWAGKPLLWQLYPQADAAHLPKLQAFLQRYLQPLSGGDASALQTEAAQCLRQLALLWNDGKAVVEGDAGGDASQPAPQRWLQLLSHQAALTAHARDWAQRLTAAAASGGGLAGRLALFCAGKLE